MDNTLDRIFKGETYTIGHLFLDGERFCDTLEDKVRPQGAAKVYGETAIPAGRYKIEFVFSPKFNRKMPALIDVKGFVGILIHWGNTPKDTEGCVLVGRNTIKGQLTESKDTWKKLFSRLYDAYERGEDIWITIQ